MAQVPTFTEAAALARLFFLAMLFGAGALSYEALASPYDCPTYDDVDATSTLNGFSAISFAYAGLALFPEMIAEARRDVNVAAHAPSIIPRVSPS